MVEEWNIQCTERTMELPEQIWLATSPTMAEHFATFKNRQVLIKLVELRNRGKVVIQNQQDRLKLKKSNSIGSSSKKEYHKKSIKCMDKHILLYSREK